MAKWIPDLGDLSSATGRRKGKELDVDKYVGGLVFFGGYRLYCAYLGQSLFVLLVVVDIYIP